mgnify:CR=1 FL=1
MNQVVSHQSSSFIRKELLLKITHHLEAKQFWDLGIKGQGVKVAIFDSGLASNVQDSTASDLKVK